MPVESENQEGLAAEFQKFAYAVSHDLRAPLRHIGQFSQMLFDTLYRELDNQEKECAEIVLSSARRAQMMLDGLLEYSRVATTEQPFVDVEAGAAARSALHQWRAINDDPVEPVAINITEAKIKGDPEQIKQLFVNLIDNAVKFRRPDVPLDVAISAERKGAEWCFAVSDNGIGIAEGFQRKVFDVFAKLHADDKIGGVGVGLAIVKRIVQRHGGWIRIQSEVGAGTVVQFGLPAH